MTNLVLKGNVFDGSDLVENSAIIVDQDKGIISGFGRVGDVEEPRSARVISGEKITILPGLIDAHVHFFGSKSHDIVEWATTPDTTVVLRSVPDLRNLLRAGFTTVRELGTKAGTHLSRAVEEGSIDGPRVVSCGRAIAQTGGDDDPTSFPLDISQQLASYSYFCDGPWECRKAVRKVIRDGAQVVKLYASGSFAQGGKIRLQFTVDEIKAIVDEGHRAAVSVAAHAYGEEALMNVVEAGVDSIEHGLGLTPRVAEEIRKKGIFYVPTMIAYMTAKPSANPERDAMIKKHVTEDLKIAKEHELKIANGSDTIGDLVHPHGQNYQEMVATAKFLGNKDALVSGTSRAGDCLGNPNIGRIRKGCAADIVVVRGNPLENIEALAPANVLHVIKQGKLYSNIS
jgi:imidazolonepropionase-like amidohydrolase